MHDVDDLAAARVRVLTTIADACARAGRDPADVTLVAVSKTVPAERLNAAVAAGLTILGENRVQEGESKAAVVEGASWHLVGPLQSNKAKRALATFDVIETVDSVGLAERLDRLSDEVRPGERVPVLLQVNVDGDAAKAGFDPDELARALPGLVALPNLELRGLMTVGRLVARPGEARPTFVALRELSARLRAGGAPAGAGLGPALGPALSMGMSDDYPIAVEEGATIVRVGRALFGERHEHHH
jgi:pyridoxal phosphate enzyme (YggS family)